MRIKTRKQLYLLEAMQRVNSVKPVVEGERFQEIAKKYGVLCHKLPIMVRNDGLAQTIAWVEEKSSAARNTAAGREAPTLAEAYSHLRAHIAATLQVEPDDLVSTIENAGAAAYLRYTSTLLEVWVYHKRFAASILDVDASMADDE